MSDENNKDDGATVVVNIKDLKEEYENIDDTKEIKDLEFSTNAGLISNKKTLVAFDFKSKTFETLVSKGLLPDDTKLARALAELNNALKNESDSCVLFNYHVESKAVNKLLNQIKKLYPKATTILMAKGLSASIIEKHSNSPSKADIYLNFPFKREEIDKILES